MCHGVTDAQESAIQECTLGWPTIWIGFAKIRKTHVTVAIKGTKQSEWQSALLELAIFNSVDKDVFT